MNHWIERRGLYCLPFPLGYPLVCDSQTKQTSPSLPGSAREASQLEREHVHRVYEEIAGHFSSTRHTPWPRVVDFLKALPSGSLVADVGCGNGKYLGINQDLYMVSHFASGSFLTLSVIITFFLLLECCFLGHWWKFVTNRWKIYEYSFFFNSPENLWAWMPLFVVYVCVFPFPLDFDYFISKTILNLLNFSQVRKDI